MTDPLAKYRSPAGALPAATLTWQLRGAGLEHFGVDGKPERLPAAEPGPREVLTRIDALGLCFSDVKLIGLGAGHPRVSGRDLAAEPVVPGHEVSLTIVAVGAEMRDRFRVGERYIVQADVVFRGEETAYGYALRGGMTQYGTVGERVLDGDEGCYLIPVHSDPSTLRHAQGRPEQGRGATSSEPALSPAKGQAIGYAEAALTEPWACVVAAYRVRRRAGLKPDGTALFIALPGGNYDECVLTHGMDSNSSPATVVAANMAGNFRDWLRGRASELGFALVESEVAAPVEIEHLRAQHAPGGFDDIVVIGADDADLVEAAARHIANGGVMNLVADKPLPRKVEIDVGRIHYDDTDYVGGPGPDIAASYRERDSELGAGPVWFIGAGGPMGQMHVQRALERRETPQVIIATDVDDDRLGALEAKFRESAAQTGKRLLLLNPAKLAASDFEAALRREAPNGFTDIVVLAPVPALIEQATAYLAPGATLNIFAGLARGTTAKLDFSSVYRHGVRWVGSSGSRIADLEFTLRETEQGRLFPNLSVAAVGDITAVREGLEAVKGGRFAGKVVIFPNLEGLALTPLAELRERLPEVYAQLGPGESWTREAEQALLRARLPRRPEGGSR
ncbi:MAG TPA: alcohol dehydrogenase catalytic domain-containing protein [Armatimonadota bacterium]|nr:alcohol dehydrogenase catalytic domain-containing protein [Armatimonadota bacterium]